MATDIRLNDDAVVIDGPLGLGTDAPQRPIHTQSGEIHSGGPAGGLSFADRNIPQFHAAPVSGQRWVWYAQGGTARLWSGTDGLTLKKSGGSFSATVNGSATIGGDVTAQRVFAAGITTSFATVVRATADEVVSDRLTTDRASIKEIDGITARFQRITGAALANVVAERLRGAGAGQATLIDCRTQSLALNHPAAPEFVEGPITEVIGGTEDDGSSDAIDDPQTPGPLPPHLNPVPPRLALHHDFGPNADRLVINQQGRYTQGVRVEGNLEVDGAVTELSSAAAKDDIRPLPTSDAVRALRDLTPVTYRYRQDDPATRRVGFVAEDVPALVAQPERDRLRVMDIVAVLTAALQEQVATVAALQAEVVALRTAVAR